MSDPLAIYHFLMRPSHSVLSQTQNVVATVHPLQTKEIIVKLLRFCEFIRKAYLDWSKMLVSHATAPAV